MKLPRGLQSGMGRRPRQPIHTNDIDPVAEEVWKNAEVVICTFSYFPAGNVCHVPTSSHLRAVLISWVVFGMSRPFLCPSVLKRQQSELGTREKALYCVK